MAQAKRPLWRVGHRWRQLCAQVKQEETVCWLCLLPLYPHLKQPHRLSTEVDHVITPDIRPDLALDRRNLRASHKTCNASRGGSRRQAARAARQPNHSRQWA